MKHEEILKVKGRGVYKLRKGNIISLVFGVLFLILVINQSIDVVGYGKGEELKQEYSEVTVDEVILKGLDTEGIRGLYYLVNEYPDLKKVTLGKDITGLKTEFLGKYSTNIGVEDEGRLCNHYYKEGFNLKYCKGLKEVSIKLSKEKIKEIYGLDVKLNETRTETEELRYRGAKFDVKYLIKGGDKYLMDLRVKVE